MSKKWSLLPKNSFPAFLFACFAPLIASAQFVVSGEYPVTPPDTEALGRAVAVDVASNGDTIVAIWADQRSDRGSDIVFTRVDHRGRALDPTGISLTSTEASETDPLISHDGAQFVAVWFDGTNTLGASFNDRGVITTPPVVIAPGRPLALLRTERDLIVAISDASGRITLYDLSSRLVPNVVQRLGRLGNIRLVRFDPGFIALWTEINSTGRYVIRAMTLDRRGAIAELTLSQLGTFEHRPTFAGGNAGGNAIIAAASQDRYAVVRMAPDGTITVIDTVDSSSAFVPRTIQDVVEAPGGFDVVMTLHNGAHIIRYTSSGKTPFVPVDGDVVAGAGTLAGEAYTVWVVDGSIIGRPSFAEPGAPPAILAHAVISQQMPALATSGASSIAVWIESFTATQDRVMARLLRNDGPPEPAVNPVVLGTRTMHFDGSTPAVAFNGTNYLAVWLDQRQALNQPAQVRLRTVTQSGGLFTELALSTTAVASSPPAIAGRPGDALVVWAEGSRTRAVMASTPFALSDIGSVTTDPAAVYGDGSFLVAAVTPAGSIRGTFVSATGALERTLFETVPPFAARDSKPAVAWSGRSYLVVFRRDNSIHGRLVGRNGETISDDFPITAGVIADNPAVTYDGGAFVVAWTERSSTDPLAEGHIFATRVLNDRTVDAVQVIVATEHNDDYPALVGVGGGHTIIGYERMSREHQDVHRVYTRLMVGPAVPIMKRRAVR